MKLRDDIAGFAAGLSICYGDEDEPRWDIIAGQLRVIGVGIYSPEDVRTAATDWIGRNCQDEISAPTVAEAIAASPGLGKPS